MDQTGLEVRQASCEGGVHCEQAQNKPKRVGEEHEETCRLTDGDLAFDDGDSSLNDLAFANDEPASPQQPQELSQHIAQLLPHAPAGGMTCSCCHAVGIVRPF